MSRRLLLAIAAALLLSIFSQGVQPVMAAQIGPITTSIPPMHR